MNALTVKKIVMSSMEDASIQLDRISASVQLVGQWRTVPVQVSYHRCVALRTINEG